MKRILMQMKKIAYKTSYKLVYLLAIILILASCTPTRKLKYVQEKQSDGQINEYYNDRSEKAIQPYDYLYIKIYSLDEKTNFIFNERDNYSASQELLSYVVDDKGYINFPFIGLIYVKDLTINEAKDKIEKSLGVYLNNISVMVRFVGNKITILGEVFAPGQYSFYDEKVTVFQAIGFARGISTFGNKERVTIIREKDNKVRYYYLDLTQKNIVDSDFYYLLPNDVVIVNPINAKYRELRVFSLNLLSSILSTTAVLISIIYINK